MKEISVVITMDCEPAISSTHATATGPTDYAMSERAILGYFDIAASYGLPVSYFVHPETIVAQPDLFKDLTTRGACIGLHVHPWKYGQGLHGGKKFMGHFGQFDYEEQLALLNECSDLWQSVMGDRPLYLRPGTFSANDTTFAAAADAGFIGGSFSAPDRQFREIYSVWTGSAPDPHRTNRHFRLKSGDMDLIDVPLTVDLSQPVDFGNQRYFHADLRPDIDWLSRYGINVRSVADNLIDQVVARAPAVPVINSVSHNQFEYQDRSDPTCQRFLLMLETLTESLNRKGVAVTGGTINDVVRATLATPPVKQPLIYI